AANSELRKQLKEKINTKFPEVRIFIPELKFTGDNAAMIAVAGYFQATKNTKTLKHKNRLDLKADPNLNL
ncbi:tRNA (adenosine(37)-N6)-threonylcarbamoyltransferase complex transferase subunit TsaD, partial [Patescibacteria group bacterium]|nr:tRNA (adenosine(37)-N6)-threonylcarbamoyltransferase complex transferase subunit TsaD [Patescibacteria group bacterium]